MKGVEHSFIILLNKKNHILNLLMDEYIRLVLVLPAAPGITDTTLIFFSLSTTSALVYFLQHQSSVTSMSRQLLYSRLSILNLIVWGIELTQQINFI
jgi:uncharacterized membrane protein